MFTLPFQGHDKLNKPSNFSKRLGQVDSKYPLSTLESDVYILRPEHCYIILNNSSIQRFGVWGWWDLTWQQNRAKVSGFCPYLLQLGKEIEMAWKKWHWFPIIRWFKQSSHPIQISEIKGHSYKWQTVWIYNAGHWPWPWSAEIFQEFPIPPKARTDHDNMFIPVASYCNSLACFVGDKTFFLYCKWPRLWGLFSWTCHVGDYTGGRHGQRIHIIDITSVDSMVKYRFIKFETNLSHSWALRLWNYRLWLEKSLVRLVRYRVL